MKVRLIFYLINDTISIKIEVSQWGDVKRLFCFEKVWFYMKKFICLSILFIFSFYTFSIEISSDLFIDGNNDEEETVEKMEIMRDELAEPNVKKVYKKKKVIIQRDLSSLSRAVDNVSKEELKVKAASDADQSVQKDSSAEFKGKSSDFVDYGDYEIHWSKMDR